MLRPAALLLLIPTIALADITGTATVIDGDTIEVAGERIRLHGIDAPETGQTCRAGGKVWRCGREAAFMLADRIGRSPVWHTDVNFVCEERDQDRYGRIVAVCFAGDEDINRWMVRNGWALAYRRYSTDYVDEESAASGAKAGIWAGEFVLPWEWRQGNRLAKPAAGPTIERDGVY